MGQWMRKRQSSCLKTFRFYSLLIIAEQLRAIAQMKKALFILPFFISLNCFAQSKSNLYLRIDSLIQFHLQYQYDSTTDQLPKRKWDSTKIIAPEFSTFPANPSPLIILDGKKINRTDLNEYTLSQIATINLYKKEDIQMLALYGTASKNGAIVIETNRFRRKRRKNKKRK